MAAFLRFPKRRQRRVASPRRLRSSVSVGAEQLEQRLVLTSLSTSFMEVPLAVSETGGAAATFAADMMTIQDTSARPDFDSGYRGLQPSARVALGNPTSAAVDLGGGSWRRDYQGGRVFWRSDRGFMPVYGLIGAEWLAFGGEDGGVFGAPRTGEIDAPGLPGGRVSHFDGGSIYWSPARGVMPVYGLIGAEWRAFGGQEGGVFGAPRTGEIAAATLPGGRVSHFDGGSIYWSPARGVMPVYGLIGAKWRELGGEGGVFGAPRTGEMAAPGFPGGRVTVFDGGLIYWSPEHGVMPVYGLIGAEWLARGGETGELGLPISGEEDNPEVSGGRRTRFQRGTIVWHPNTGVIVSVDPPFSLMEVSSGDDGFTIGFPEGQIPLRFEDGRRVTVAEAPGAPVALIPNGTVRNGFRILWRLPDPAATAAVAARLSVTNSAPQRAFLEWSIDANGLRTETRDVAATEAAAIESDLRIDTNGDGAVTSISPPPRNTDGTFLISGWPPFRVPSNFVDNGMSAPVLEAFAIGSVFGPGSGAAIGGLALGYKAIMDARYGDVWRLHDYLYSREARTAYPNLTRAMIDTIMRQHLIDQGASDFHATSIYLAVQEFGESHFESGVPPPPPPQDPEPGQSFLSVSPAQVTATVGIGLTDGEETFTVTNSSEDPVTLTVSSSSSKVDVSAPNRIDPKGSVTVTVKSPWDRFKAAGSESATITVRGLRQNPAGNTDDLSQTVSVPVSLTVLAPILDVTPRLDETREKGPEAFFTVTIRNTGDPRTQLTFQCVDDGSSAMFVPGSASTLTLKGQESTTIQIRVPTDASNWLDGETRTFTPKVRIDRPDLTDRQEKTIDLKVTLGDIDLRGTYVAAYSAIGIREERRREGPQLSGFINCTGSIKLVIDEFRKNELLPGIILSWRMSGWLELTGLEEVGDIRLSFRDVDYFSRIPDVPTLFSEWRKWNDPLSGDETTEQKISMSGIFERDSGRWVFRLGTQNSSPLDFSKTISPNPDTVIEVRKLWSSTDGTSNLVLR